MSTAETLKTGEQGDPSPELGHVPVLPVPLSVWDIQASPENEELYRPVIQSDPDIQALAASIKTMGLLEPLVVTADYYILSGHRRHQAAIVAGLAEVPCHVVADRREGNPNFVALLREHNRQRVKTLDELVREEVVSANPEEAHRVLVEHRKLASQINVAVIGLRERKARSEISSAKHPFLEAIDEIIDDLEDYWPLSDRQIHYQLLNDPPLKHASKRKSRYRNDKSSFKSLCELLTRARIEGRISMDAIDDPTRPVTTWNVFSNVQDFYRQSIADLLKGYYRDLLQSQPNHIEIVAEKNTLDNIIRPVAEQFCAAYTIGRGYCSTPPKRDIARRFRASGKSKLILLFIGDFDPDGDEIAHSTACSLRDDFQVAEVTAIKVAVTHEQVMSLELPPSFEQAKKTSPNYKRFKAKYGSDNVYEVEALSPDILQRLLRETMDSVIDVAAFNAELEAEKRDAAHIVAVREQMLKMIGTLDTRKHS